MNIVHAYAYVRSYCLAFVLGTAIWICSLAMMSPPGSASAFGIVGLFLTCSLFGLGFSGVCYFALHSIRNSPSLRPGVDLLLWGATPAATLIVFRFGSWSEVLTGAIAGAIAGTAFWLLSRNIEPGVADESAQMAESDMAQSKPYFHRDSRRELEP
jgi:hypothetical protein